MNCLEFRRQVGAQPELATADVVEHAAQCAECGRYREDLLCMESRIRRALLIEVPRRGAAARQPRIARWGLAASVAAALVAGVVLWSAGPPQSLAAQLVAHAKHDGNAVGTSQLEDPARVANVLASAGVRLNTSSVGVSYAHSCPLRGQRVPHLVVQSEAGPVVVLLLTREKRIERPQTFEEGGYSGVIMPAPRGVPAVLGQGVLVENVAARVLAAVDYGA
jgi:hypothetical protein